MNKIKICIIDDEKQGQIAVSSIIEKKFSELEIVAFADSKTSAIQMINDLKPEIIILDINLGDGTGFDVLKALENPPKTIFVTAYDEFAIKAFKFNAIDYILKPFDSQELVEAIQKAISTLENSNSNFPEKELSKMEDKKLDKIVIQSSKGFEVISFKDITYLKSDNNYTTFYLSNNQRKVVSKTLKYFDELLVEFGFYRCHQSFLIQLNQIKSFLNESGGVLLMNNGDKIDVSRRKKEDLFKIINSKFLL
jgi:two-component system, LytTR family, response regulator